MRKTYISSIEKLTMAFRRLESQLPHPIITSLNNVNYFRYIEKNIHQAIIQKLARYISGLCAIDVLLSAGFVQEQAVLQRTLDEIGDDILFLVYAITNDSITDLHQQFLDYFWQEELDGTNLLHSPQKRGMVRRDKIHAYLSRASGSKDPSTSNAVQRTLHKTYSGYVHAASPHIMEMVGGDPPHFHVNGMRGTPKIAEHARDAGNYFYRGFLATTSVAKAFGDQELVDTLYCEISEFERAMGESFSGGAFNN